MQSWILSSFSVTWSFRNHADFGLFFKYWKQLCCFIFLLKPWCTFIFQDSLMNRKFKRPHLFEIEIFCNIIDVFTVTFDQFEASLLNKSRFFSRDMKEISPGISLPVNIVSPHDIIISRGLLRISFKVIIRSASGIDLCACHIYWRGRRPSSEEDLLNASEWLSSAASHVRGFEYYTKKDSLLCCAASHCTSYDQDRRCVSWFLCIWFSTDRWA